MYFSNMLLLNLYNYLCYFDYYMNNNHKGHMLMVLYEEIILQRVAFGSGISLLLLFISCCLVVFSPHTRLWKLISTMVIGRGTISEKYHCQLVFKVSNAKQIT